MDIMPPAIEQAAPVIQSGQDLLPVLKRLENSGDDAHNPKSGSTGAYQIHPATGRAYGVEPHELLDPKVNEGVATTLANDLWKRYHGNVNDVLVAWNAGTRLANRWIASGRTMKLPRETRGYLSRAAGYLSVGGQPASPVPPQGLEVNTDE